jgi:DNA-binding FadR family transcriptional regulator
MTSSDPRYDVKERLLAGLRDSQWQPGQRLPTERQMCAQYNVGRAAVRRALGELKQLGLITQTVGSGTYVAKDAAEKLMSATPAAISPAQLMEARLVFEPGLVDLIVRNATADDFAVLEACCRNADAAATLTQFEHWDGAFHQGLAHATHNGFVNTVFALITKVRNNGEWGLLKKKSATPERRVIYQREHWSLLAALRNRDADTARTALISHLINVRYNMFD